MFRTLSQLPVVVSLVASLVVSLAVSGAAVGVAHADVVDPDAAGWHPMGTNGGYCGTTAVPDLDNARRGSPRAVSKVLFVNRCIGGCSITGSSTANAPLNQSAVPGLMSGRTYDIPEFKSFQNNPSPDVVAQEQWDAIMGCVRETMSYYNIEVTDVRPQSGGYHMSVVGGFDENIEITSGSGGQLLGISQLDCAGGIDNVISFTLAGESRLLAGNANNYVRDVCKTIVHEAGHAYGLEHEFKWLDDGTSACADPMSYDTVTCDPSPAYFRNRIAGCGEFATRNCQCGGSANSHAKLAALFGAGTPTVPPPTVAITTPSANVLAGAVAVNAGSKRGVARIELYLNGWKWDTKPGVAFAGGGGQPNPAAYGFTLPARVPNGVYDIEVKAYDDLGVTSSATATATKGSACSSADTCLSGQKCESGKCFWDQPTADFGADCTYDEFCLSGMCAGTEDTKICTQTCIPGTADSCPEGLRCIETGATDGICFLPDDSGGCCRVDGGNRLPWLPAGISLSVLALLMRRRRR